MQYGIEKVVVSRKLAAHHGFQVNPVFIEGKHDRADSFVSEFDGIRYFTDNVDWLVTKASFNLISISGKANLTGI